MDSNTPILDKYLNQPSDAAAPPPEVPAPAPANDTRVNVINPEGKLVSIPQSQVEDAMATGYQHAKESDIQGAQDQKDYSTPLHKLNTFANSLTMGAFPAIEHQFSKLTGREYDPEIFEKEAKANPITSGAGTGALLTFGGFGNALERGVAAGAEALAPSLAPATEAIAPYVPKIVAKIGSTAVKAAAENVLFQSADESTKLLAGSPGVTTDTAISNIGMSGLFGAGLGAGFGAVSPIWTATMGGKTASFLGSLADRLGGKEGIVSDTVDRAITDSGLNIPPEARAAASSDPWVRNMASTLEQSDTTSAGPKFQKTMKEVRNQASEGITQSLGKTEADLANIKNQSNFEAGQTVQDQISKEYKAISEPIANAYEQIESKFKGVAFPEELKAAAQENLANAANAEGWKKLPDSAELKMVDRASQALNNVENLNDLRQLQSNLGKEATRDQLWAAKKVMDRAFAEARESLIDSALGQEAPEVKAQFKQTQADYRALMDATDELNSRLKVGSTYGPKDFLYKLGEQNAETTLNRLGKSNDAGLLKFLQEKFPETAQSIREFHVNSILNKASEVTAEGAKLNSAKALKAIQNMSPELRQFALPEGAVNRVQAIQTYLKAIEDANHNFSNTARTADKLWSFLPGSAISLVSFLATHNPALSFVLGPLVKYLGKDVPDAARLGLLKFLGSQAPMDAGGFKTMVDFIHAAKNGESAASKAVKGIFQSGRLTIPQAFDSEKSRDKFDQKLQKMQTDTQAMLQMGGSLGHYLPDHGTALAQRAQNAVSYLNSLRPAVDRKNPLDSEVKPSKVQLAAFHNALEIAEQPLSVLPKIQQGNLTVQDLVHLKTLYPGLYSRLSQKLNEQMIEAVHDEKTIPYATKMGLSLFMGQPLDSTMTPQAIQAAQTSMHSMVQPPSQQGQHPKHSMNALNKFGMNEATPGQKRESSRGSRA